MKHDSVHDLLDTMRRTYEQDMLESIPDDWAPAIQFITEAQAVMQGAIDILHDNSDNIIST